MYYILNEKIALRSWWLVLYAYYVRYRRFAKRLSEEEYHFLLKCDGTWDLPEDETAKELCERGLCRPIKKGEAALLEWQKPLVCENRYMPSVNWMITGKCNYNCLHCFNAKDHAPLQSEFSWEEARKFLNEARECGINGFTITGGEPMVHRHFMDIVRGIYARGMYIFELNTNGFYLTQEILDEMKQIGCFPLIKISFDGIGYHDYMRGHKGAEEDALRAIRLCIANGFSVKVQMQLNRGNKDVVLESLNLLDQMGVWETRIIRTTESPRWKHNAEGQTLTFSEYYDMCLEIAKTYVSQNHQMWVMFHQFLTLFPEKRSYTTYGEKRNKGLFRENLPLCGSNRGMIAVGSDGQVYPCLQMSGWFLEHGIKLGNVKTTGLKKILQNGDYMREICMTVQDLTKENGECRQCPYLKECCGGCRVYGILTGGGPLGSDLSKCLYFKEEYPQKIKKALSGCRYEKSLIDTQ